MVGSYVFYISAVWYLVMPSMFKQYGFYLYINVYAVRLRDSSQIIIKYDFNMFPE